MSSNIASPEIAEKAADDKKVLRWLNFGSCLFRIAFDTPAFYDKPLRGLPIQVNKVWRREISAVLSDWDTASDIAKDLPPSPFSEAWLSSKSVFAQADVILVDLVLDIFQPRGLRFKRPGELGGTSYDQIVSNFPEEPPANLPAALGSFECNAQSSLQAWERFGQEIKTPTVFVTMEHRDDIAPGYSEDFRRKLLSYQAALQELSQRFPHWLVVSLDDIFAPIGKECYVDRHHPSELGWSTFRSGLPMLILDSGIIRDDAGGPPLPMRNWNIPERCDFSILNLEHLGRLRPVGRTACAVGPTRLTSTARTAFGADLEAYASFSPLAGKPSPELIIILKWSQPIDLQAWLAGLIKQHPDSLIEMPSLWRGRENNMLGEAEKLLRKELKALGMTHKHATVDMQELTPPKMRYVARCLLGTHRFDHTAGRLIPLLEDKQAPSLGVALPDWLVDALATTNLVPVFGEHS